MIHGIGPRGCNLSHGTCCGAGLKCIDGICRTNDFGKTCKFDLDCRGEMSGNMIAGCIEGKCRPLFNARERCESNDQCYGTMKCGDDGRCQPFQLGDSCTPPMYVGDEGIGGQTCEFGLRCERQTGRVGRCQKAKVEYEPCSYPGECLPGHFCDIFSKTCLKMFSKGKGEPCTFGKACQEGLICDAETSVNATCTDPVDEPKMKLCDDDDDCDSEKKEYCACSYYTGESYCLPASGKPLHVLTTQVYSRECSKKVNEALKCYDKHRCTSFLPSLQKNSCARENCEAETRVLLGCDTCDPMAERMFGACYSKQMRDICRSRHAPAQGHGPIGWWAAGIALGCLLVGAVLVAVVVSLGVAIRRRRRTGYIPVQ